MSRVICTAAMLLLATVSVAAEPAPGPAEPPELPPVLLQMIRNDAVHQELELTAEQSEDVFAVINEVDGPWFRARILPAEKRAAEIKRLTEQLRQSLAAMLSDDQISRLTQLENQALGTRMVALDRTADALSIAPQSRQELYEVFRETDRTAAKTQSKVQSGDLSADQAAKVIEQAKTDELKAVNAALSNDQKRKLAGLTGAAFDFQQLKRVYPAAPQLSSQGSNWLQGEPVTLEQLQGKVVAVHFYAFQCINCRRNLPHYNAWYKDYADQGLVVVGIQTPETSAERSAEKVAAAIQAEGIEYPVLMDAQAANWRNWGNTMWPTVYLIDKQGYLRRWWQGELNWKDTPGEQQMRGTIEQLLAEQN